MSIQPVLDALIIRIMVIIAAFEHPIIEGEAAGIHAGAVKIEGAPRVVGIVA